MSSIPGKQPPSSQVFKPAVGAVSSVGTAQRITSSPNRTGIRPAGANLRAQSPTAATRAAVTGVSKRPMSPEMQRRPKTPHSRSSSLSGITEGIGNLNRWSQSTVSSKASGGAHKRKNSFTRRLSGSFGSFAPFTNPQSSPTSKTYLKKPIQSPGNSPQRPAPKLPPTQSVSRFVLGTTVDTAITPASESGVTTAPAALINPSNTDYFGGNWMNRPSPGQQAARDRPTQISASTNSPPRSRGAGNGTGSGSTKSVSAVASHSRDDSRSAQHRHHDQPSRSSHTRNSNDPERRSDGTGPSSTAVSSQGERRRQRKEPSQKIMLSKALQKANHAVLLDSAQNFEGAIAAYKDACELLQQVMKRSSGDDDRRKLEVIRTTYMNRVVELETSELLSMQAIDKALPDVPARTRDRSESDSNKSIEPFSPVTESEDEDLTVASSHSSRNKARGGRPWLPHELPRDEIPPRRQSLLPPPANDDGGLTPRITTEESLEPIDSWSIDSPRESMLEVRVGLAPPMEKEYMPPPLSPRRPLSPTPSANDYRSVSEAPVFKLAEHPSFQHSRQDTVESTSWLDTIDESGGSSASSVHSRSSFAGLRRKHIRAPSGATEAEFDAALDAAVEAAYDDGFEPVTSPVMQSHSTAPMSGKDSPHFKSQAVFDPVRIQAREPERTPAIDVSRQEIGQPAEIIAARSRNNYMDDDYEDDEAEEEERLLEEMTRDYIMYETQYDIQTKSALPRQSDSSGFSGRTWGSSIGSNPATAGTTLSTVAEFIFPPLKPGQVQSKAPSPPTRPPPSGALPPPPPALNIAKPIISQQSTLARSPSLSQNSTPGVRQRRLSGQKIKELKIDTTAKLPPGMAAPRSQPLTTLAPEMSFQAISDPPKSASLVSENQQSVSNSMLKPLPTANGLRQPSSPLPGPSPIDSGSAVSTGAPPLTKTASNNFNDNPAPPIPHSPSRILNKAIGPGILKKNFSSSSLKSIRQPSGPALVISDDSPSTPLTRGFSTASSTTRNGQLPSVPDLPTPMVANFSLSGLSLGGLHYFDVDIHSRIEPGTPNPSVANPPLALEACPESFLLRPFWLMRAINNAVSHPRGGYLSTRLFVPRDIWRVKNVKIKSEDDKVSCCDLLTAALGKLDKVDNLDADAVLEAMQDFELVLDQVQATLSKKLGGEVGVQASVALFRASPIIDENETLSARSTNTSSKSYLSTWRKLRSKNSQGPGIQQQGNSLMTRDGARDSPLTMKSLPMTANIHRRFPKREVSRVQGVGPHAQYMAALTRLCDAVQVLDEIARQAEDPGLKYSSQTHVGLELSMRHAAEFFAFYVCRFVLSDMGMMLDKFIKRGSEWVLV